MSNLLFLDESNGNGVYASKSNTAAAGATTTTTTASATVAAAAANNINNIINAATAAATLPTSVSSEDLSQSLSEYTDADESISAPTEFLAEFLSAVMLKDYKKALKYCKLILQYEPNNATANEFYPLIQEKLKEATVVVNSSDSDENYNKSSSPELVLELQASTEPSTGESDEASDDQQVGSSGIRGGAGAATDNSSGENISNSSSYGSDRIGQNISNSAEENDEIECEDEGEDEDEDEDDNGDDEVEGDVEVEDDEDVDDVDDEDDDDDDDDDEAGEDEPDSSSGDDLPIDDNPLLGGDDAGGGDGRRIGCHAFHSPRNSSSGGEGRSRSDNTTHSYSSLLLEEEEEDDIVPGNLRFCKELSSPDLDVSNGNKVASASCSDSESPTEPLTQRLAAILRSKCAINSKGENY